MWKGCAVVVLSLICGSVVAGGENKPKEPRAKEGAPASQQQASPSLQETTDWLKEKLPASTGGTFAPGGIVSEERYKEFKLEGCVLSYGTSFKIAGNRVVPTMEENTEVTIPIGSLDPAGIEVSKTEQTPGLIGVSLKTSAAEEKITVKSFSRGAGGGIKHTAKAYILIQDEAVAGRIAKAFQHAATLCRARKEVF